MQSIRTNRRNVMPKTTAWMEYCVNGQSIPLTVSNLWNLSTTKHNMLQRCLRQHTHLLRDHFYKSRNQLIGTIIVRQYNDLRQKHEKDIVNLPEYKSRSNLQNFLRSKAGRDIPHQPTTNVMVPTPPPLGYENTLTQEQIKLCIDAAIATFHLHVESRIASLCGKGFYTIGPCGEEMLCSIGFAIDPYVDALALHYRHLSTSIVRQLRLGRSLEDIMLDRARGYCVSKLDPVTGGVHCAIGSATDASVRGGGGGDYIVTSTLASQCPPAVGRALGFSIADKLFNNDDTPNSTKPISFVTIGDGSVHNVHFLSAFNLARHARYRRKKCPVVFGISDNGLSISYNTGGYAKHWALSNSQSPLVPDGIPLFKANGCDMIDVYDKTAQATRYSRKHSAPSLILYEELTRRFGHAATDRQHAYLDPSVIESMEEKDVVAGAIVQAVEQWNAMTYSEVCDRFEEIGDIAMESFNSAAKEPKITSRAEMLERVAQPMVPVAPLPSNELLTLNDGISSDSTASIKGKKRDVMRKHMTRVIEEVMEANSRVVYIGEDVEHGGYYCVTAGLVKKFPKRVIDFPPDETTLLGAAQGFSQVGLLPITEIPYSKYLDCGVDMFYELANSNWLSNAQRPNGMIIRIQGFDKGVFGGNFHTHNMISHVPPGIDVLCYSNGRDYARGFRNAIIQAQHGRVVVFVDCTNLLNLRHLHNKDRGWETTYPEETEMMSFNDVRRFGNSGKVLIVTYGNGVVTALRARQTLVERRIISNSDELDILDCPYISAIPDGLRNALSTGMYEGVLFADICKEGPGSNVLSAMIVGLKTEGLLNSNWEFVAAPRTYNPLGNLTTFLNEEDIISSFLKLQQSM